MIYGTRRAHTAALLPDGRVLVVGGYIKGESGTTATTEIWELGDDYISPSLGPELNVPRANHTMVVLPTRVIVLGGSDGQQSLASIEVLDFGKKLGEACASDTECLSEHCVDGVCCDTACEGACVACTTAFKGAGEDGVCEVVAEGTNPRSLCVDEGPASCGTTGVCDANGSCAVYEDGTECSEGMICKAGGCIATPFCWEKLDGTDCGDGMICEAGECVSAPPCWQKPDGTACGEGTICLAGECITAPFCWGRPDGTECGENMICRGGKCITTPPCWEQPDGTLCSAGGGCTMGICRDEVCVETRVLDGTKCEGGTCLAGQCKRVREPTPPSIDGQRPRPPKPSADDVDGEGGAAAAFRARLRVRPRLRGASRCWQWSVCYDDGETSKGKALADSENRPTHLQVPRRADRRRDYRPPGKHGKHPPLSALTPCCRGNGTAVTLRRHGNSPPRGRHSRPLGISHAPNHVLGMWRREGPRRRARRRGVRAHISHRAVHGAEPYGRMATRRWPT